MTTTLPGTSSNPGRLGALVRSPILLSVLGALLIGVVNNGLILMGLETSQQEIIRGGIIIVAVALARRK